MTPEVNLLLCCAHSGISEPEAARIRELAKREIKWHKLLRLGNYHKTSPLLYRRLSAIGSDRIPKAVLRRWRQRDSENARRSLLMTGELFRLLALLEQHGIEAIPYKGPVLAMLAYGDLSAREFGDLDILVHEKDHLPARDLLVAHGYQLHLTKAQQLLKRLHHYHYELTRADNGARVEIHWEFTENFWPFRSEPLRLWERLQPVSLAGKQVESFHPEDLLFILCAHAAKHLWQKLIWISDIAHLIQAHPEMKWARILEQAEAIGCRRILFVNLLLANRLLGMRLPEFLQEKIPADRPAFELVQEIEKLLLEWPQRRLRRTEMLALYFKMRERQRDRLPLIFYDLNEPQASNGKVVHKDFRLPQPLSFLYYALRPAKMVLKGLGHSREVYRFMKGEKVIRNS